MANAAVLITAVVACATLSSTYAARGVILTVPRSLEKNAENKLYMSLYDIDAPGTVAISLQRPDSNEILTETVVPVEKGENEKVIKLKVPDSSEYMMRIWANGSFDTTDGGYNFFEEDEVYFHSTQSIITFIQTDKPIYKPGQQVQFRVLPVDRTLRPLGKDTQGHIWVEDTSGSRMAQWKNVSFAKGIEQFSFPLSDEPPLGTWKISADVEGTLDSTTFEIKEYVLPKFEVVIKPPSYVLADAQIIPIEICAKYTYGKEVQGSLTINNSLESYSWSSEKFPVYEIEDKIDGCYKYDLNVSLVDSEYTYVYRRIEITAQVTEDGTGVVRNGSESISRTHNALTLEFLDDEYKQYFKPGIPYVKKVKVTKPDNTPAPNEDIQICATISRQRVLVQWWATRKVKYCRNYTSDADGIILFKVPPQKLDTISLYLEAKSITYEDSTARPGRPKVYQPQTSTTVQPYYSPSKSYIQVQNADGVLKCGTSQKVKVLYTTKDGGNYVFYYQVISKGQVMEKGSKEVTFADADNVAGSMCKDPSSVNKVRIPLVPSAAEQGEMTEEDVDCSSGPIGSAEIDIDITAVLSPSFRLLVYYIRDDDETVADSAKFNVEKCFQNKVQLKFADEERQPGAKTSFTLKASPNSICGTKVLDKSVTLLDSSDQLTNDKVFEELKKFDLQQYYQRNHCNDKFRKGGKNKMAHSMILPPRPWSSSQYADALTAFEDTGFIVLSDLTLLTRPCSKNQGYEGYGGIALASVGVRGGQPGPPPVPENHAFSADRSSVEGVQKLGGVATKSVVDVRSFFPDTWLFDIVSLGDTGELISKATLPHTITEWVGNAVCINEADGLGLSDTTGIKGFQAFFLEFTLPYSVKRGEKVPLIVSTFNYLDKCLPVTRTINVAVIAENGTVMAETSTSGDVCVCGGKTDTFKFMFTPSHVGTLNLTVLAETTSAADVCGDKETANVVARDMATRSLEVEAEGFPQEKVNSFLFCPDDYDESTYKEKLELLVPDGSVDGSRRAFISLSGDIMGPAIDGLDRLVQLPTGCGEQNMVLFTPNIVVLDYLTSIGKLTDSVKSKAVTNLKTGYQRELKYRHPDGSYSAFGVSDREGSMFLSAFVLKSFSQARRYIDIDAGDINRTTKWIVQKQQADGCFPQVGKMLSQGMKGGVGSQGKESTAPLTAYVLSALLISGYQNETVTSGALKCIAMDANLTPYTASLYGYATVTADKPETDMYLEWLSEKEITKGDETYWKNINGSKSLDVETAAYAVITILKKRGDAGLSKALSIIRHLTRLRNTQGGFISTQDTVVGLEAIALFASIISQDPVNLVIKLKGDTLDETIAITEDDKLLVKKNRVSVIPSTVEVTATGAGCGLLQASVRYNTYEVPKQEFFLLTVSAARKAECKTAEIKVCACYLPENHKSNMALIEIRMVSGFSAVKDSLQKLLEGNSADLKRYEVDNNNVVFYFDEMSNDKSCLTFDVEEVIPVEDSKPATVKVYDYYAKEKEESADYSITGSC